jgi:hypothetical protein
VSYRKPSFAVFPSLGDTLARVTMSVGLTAATLLAPGPPFSEAQTPAPGKRSDILRTLPITKFYDTPDPLPTGKPGELIRSQEFEQYNSPSQSLPFAFCTTRVPLRGKM